MEKTETAIFNAAREIFMQKGYHGARMQEIADNARINKSQLHYYHRSKSNLYERVFEDSLQKILPPLVTLLNSEKGLYQKIDDFVNDYIPIIYDQPHLSRFIIGELSQHSAEFAQRMIPEEKYNFKPFKEQIRQLSNQRAIKNIDPEQLFLNLLSLIIFPVLAKSLVQPLMDIDNETYEELLENRKKELVTFILKALEPDT